MRNSGENNQYHHKIEQNAITPQQQFHGTNINKDGTPYSSKLQSTVIYTSDDGPGLACISLILTFWLRHYPFS